MVTTPVPLAGAAGYFNRNAMTSLTYNAIQRACKIIDVVGVQSGHGYTPIRSQINVPFYKRLTLRIVDPRETM